MAALLAGESVCVLVQAGVRACSSPTWEVWVSALNMCMDWVALPAVVLPVFLALSAGGCPAEPVLALLLLGGIVIKSRLCARDSNGTGFHGFFWCWWDGSGD
jgi:hypothetical protein